jgi:two-component system KDP operon response regulator KdpE
METGVPEKPARILVADDEELMRRLLTATLARHNYEVVVAATGNEALNCALEHDPDLVILDLLLPDMSGVDVCRKLREWRPVPILVVSGRDEESMKITLLDLGADDYITKPFSTGELLARIRALLRRSTGAPLSPVVITAGALKIDIPRRRIFQTGRELRLTRTEFDILAYLAQNANCVVSSKMLVQKVWGLRYVDDTQTLRVHIGHIRKKIESAPSDPKYILTEQGIGYRFVGPVAPAA